MVSYGFALVSYLLQSLGLLVPWSPGVAGLRISWSFGLYVTRYLRGYKVMLKATVEATLKATLEASLMAILKAT